MRRPLPSLRSSLQALTRLPRISLVLSITALWACEAGGPPQIVGECNEASDCEPGFVCVDHECLQVCQRNADCGGGFFCENSVCVPIEPGECGNGQRVGAEECDDANDVNGDGCDDQCRIEPGWVCAGSPSTCAPACGNQRLDAGESCDDGNNLDGDGCGATCANEAGWICQGQPSVCAQTCGNSTLDPGEACDDGAFAGGDGCSETCQLEAGWVCTGVPSTCTTVCGDGLVRGDETCDDGGTEPDDGCDATCVAEDGYVCREEPSICDANCGDGALTGAETCDDGNGVPGDGCSDACAVEEGWTCGASLPSACTPTCGDGLVRGDETCDPGPSDPVEGCAADCTTEPGYSCSGEPSVCAAGCGDGVVAGNEQCDDAGQQDGDGCSAACTIEANATCTGEPSECTIDRAPDPITFDAVADAAPSTQRTSNQVTLSGFYGTLQAIVSPANAILLKNGAQVPSGTQVTAGDTVALRATSASSFGTGASVSLVVGDTVGSWTITTKAYPANCKEARAAGATASGVYTVDPDGGQGAAPFDVYCDMVTDGGGWTLVMRADAVFTGFLLGQGLLINWYPQTGEANFGQAAGIYGPGQQAFTTNFAQNVWKFSDARINALVTEAYRVVGDGNPNQGIPSRTRFWRGACVYRHNVDPAGTDCAVSYADAAFTTGPQGGLSNGLHGGLSDWAEPNRLFFVTSDARNAAPDAIYWWVGNAVDGQYWISEQAGWQMWVR